MISPSTTSPRSSRDPSKAPLVRDVKMAENIRRIRPGEGLWKTASARPTTFRILVLDTISQQVGFLAVVLPAVYVFKIWGGQSHEIEANGFLTPYDAPTEWECN